MFFFDLVDSTPATLVMVLCHVEHRIGGDDSHEASPYEVCAQYMQYVGMLQERGIWWAHCFGYGALFYKVGRYSAVADCDSGPLEDDDTNWVFSSFNVTLCGDFFNDSAVIVVACVFNKEVGEAEPWGRGFLGRMKERIVKDEVRFLCGMMRGVPKEQVADLGRSCGASSNYPLHQVWRKRHYNVTHPAYIIPFGPCHKFILLESRLAPPDLKGMPTWLEDAAFAMPTRYLPSFSIAPWSALLHRQRNDLPDLGMIKQKKVDLAEWVEGVHQLLLWVGCKRPGQKARQRHEQRVRALESQFGYELGLGISSDVFRAGRSRGSGGGEQNDSSEAHPCSGDVWSV